MNVIMNIFMRFCKRKQSKQTKPSVCFRVVPQSCWWFICAALTSQRPAPLCWIRTLWLGADTHQTHRCISAYTDLTSWLIDWLIDRLHSELSQHLFLGSIVKSWCMSVGMSIKYWKPSHSYDRKILISFKWFELRYGLFSADTDYLLPKQILISLTSWVQQQLLLFLSQWKQCWLHTI